jgi:hypothetical protein
LSQENVLTQASNAAAKCSIHQRFLNIHQSSCAHVLHTTKHEDFFRTNLFPYWSMLSLYPSQLCFFAGLGLLLCDFYLKINHPPPKKKNPTTNEQTHQGITRLTTVLCLCPSILHTNRIQDLDHVLRRELLGETYMPHPAHLSHLRNIGWKGLWWPASFSHLR